jgi:hypothetical protein
MKKQKGLSKPVIEPKYTLGVHSEEDLTSDDFSEYAFDPLTGYDVIPLKEGLN